MHEEASKLKAIHKSEKRERERVHGDSSIFIVFQGFADKIQIVTVICGTLYKISLGVYCYLLLRMNLFIILVWILAIVVLFQSTVGFNKTI